MNNPHLKFHHFGLAVRRPEEARAFVSVLGYQVGDAVHDPRQNVNAQFCTHPAQPAVEIIWQSETHGPTTKLVGRYPDGIIYHVCYETENLQAALAQFSELRLKVICVSPPTETPLFGGRKVSFYNAVGIGLIEILE